MGFWRPGWRPRRSASVICWGARAGGGGARGPGRFDYEGRFSQVQGLGLEPRPCSPLTVFQGGQSEAAQAMAARHADWLFLNGGPPEKIAGLIASVRARAAELGRTVRFA